MRFQRSRARVSETGFTLIEVLIVLAIILIMAAVSLPQISAYIRNFHMSGALRDVTGEIQSARNQAIMKNTNAGVSFVIVDANSYRFVREDLKAPGGPPNPPEYFGPLKDLPAGVFFQPAAVASFMGLRFTRLGADCVPGSTTNCGPDPFAGPGGPPFYCTATELVPGGRCVDQNPLVNYIGGTTAGPDTQDFQVTLIERQTGLTKTISIAPGGRVRTNKQ